MRRGSRVRRWRDERTRGENRVHPSGMRFLVFQNFRSFWNSRRIQVVVARSSHAVESGDRENPGTERRNFRQEVTCGPTASCSAETVRLGGPDGRAWVLRRCGHGLHPRPGILWQHIPQLPADTASNSPRTRYSLKSTVFPVSMRSNISRISA